MLQLPLSFWGRCSRVWQSRIAGAGFAWQPFLEIEPSRATQGSGRGIAKANLISFDELIYQGKGNQVQAICYLR
jgi:hypothetical protein